MRRVLPFLMALLIALAPAFADARPLMGGSMGSRGSRGFSAPPSTSTAPFGASPMQRSLTPNGTPSYGNNYGNAYGGGGFGGGYGRSSFGTGLMGGLIGAGLGGMLFGHGFFGGIRGGFGFLGFLLQMFLLYFLVRWLFRNVFAGRPAMAGGGIFGRMMNPGPAPNRAAFGGRPSGRPITITQADYRGFEQVLRDIQVGWSAHDLNALRGLVTPEMLGYFGEQLAEQASRGVRNETSAVHLLQGDLSEAWSEGSREYATVAMKSSMIDVTRDQAGRIVDGSPTERVTATEFWTFLRSPGGRWILSAIQQAR